MSAKKYVSKLFLKHSTFVMLEGGRKANLEFTGGIGGTYKRGGYIIVTDPEIQEAIESDKRYKIEFVLAQTFPDDTPIAKQPTIKIDEIKYVTPDVEEEVKEEVETETKEEVKEEVEVEKPIDLKPDYKIIDSVTDSQLARNYFRDLGETGMASRLGKPQINMLCDKYKISFPNLK